MKSNNDNLMDNIKSDLYEICINIKNSLTQNDLDKLINGTNEDINYSTGVPLLINYLKSHINFIITGKKTGEDINNSFSYIESIKQFESYIRKLENDIKYFIKKQFEDKIYRDSLQLKLKGYIQMEEDYEELRQKVRYDNGKFLDNDRKDNEIIILRRENSNLKKEIIKFNEKFEQSKELEEKYNELEKVHINDEENIKNLNLKIEQLNIQINKLNIKLNNSNNNNNNKILLRNNKEIIKINEFNSLKSLNYKQAKTNFEKFKISSTAKVSKYKDTNYLNPLNMFYNESKKFKSRTTKTMDSIIYNPMVKSITFNQDIFTQMKSKRTPNVKRKMTNSKSLMSDKKENSDIRNKIIQIKENNFLKKNNNVRSRNNKISDKFFSENKFLLSNNNSKKELLKNKKHDKNIIYEHSALNVLGFPHKYKI